MRRRPLMKHMTVAAVVALVGCAHGQKLAVQSVSLPSINTHSLGNLGVIGQFDAITRYSYVGQQNETQPVSDTDDIIFQLGKDQLLIRNSTDGIVTDSCSMNGIIYFAGNFTHVGSKSAVGIASVNATSGEINALGGGVNGTVHSLYCHQPNNTVYIGGENIRYQGGHGTVVWDANKKHYAAPLFGGFKQGAVVNSIINYSENIIFGGSFNGLQNDSILSTSSGGNISSNVAPLQQVGFKLVSVTAEGTAPGTDPTSILCPDSGSGWSLTDNRQGTWEAYFPWFFVPRKLRLYNLKDSDNGVKSWRFLAFPLNGIMNFTYVDPSSGNEESCSAFCPLLQSSAQDYMDFTFVNNISMNSFQLYINEFYGAAAGLSGIELFQDPLSCQKISSVGRSSLEGTGWQTVSAPEAMFESITINDPSQFSSYSATLSPNITAKGNYSVLLFTPGCSDDNTCAQRGQVNVTVYPGDDIDPVSTIIYQTNVNEKYNQIYNGTIDPTRGYQPRVVLEPVVGQATPLVFVAQKMQTVFHSGETTSTVSISSLFEFNYNNFTILRSNSSYAAVGNTTVNAAGVALGENATVNSMLALSNLYVGGKFTSEMGGSNFAVIDKGLSSVQNSGLNGPVSHLFSSGKNSIIALGDFSNTAKFSSSGLSNIAQYNTSAKSWSSIGGGVNGNVESIVSYNLNGTLGFALSGNFTQVSNYEVPGFALWLPGYQQWLQASPLNQTYVVGRLSSGQSVGLTEVYFGSLQLFDAQASGAVFIDSNFDVTPMPFSLSSSSSSNSSSSLSKRAQIMSQSGNTINTAVFANDSVTVLGGHFRALDSQGSTVENLLILNSNSSFGLTDNGLQGNNSVVELLVDGSKLYVGGTFNATIGEFNVGSLLIYDLNNQSYAQNQPAGLSGGQQTVTSLNIRPDTQQLIVMGSFEKAGSLGCAAFCIYDLQATRWLTPASGLSGLISTSVFIGTDIILFAGDVQLNSTEMYFGQYDFTTSSFQACQSLSSGLPGPVNSFVLNGDGVESVFASGLDTKTNAAYLSHWNNSIWTRLDSVFGTGTVITQLSLLQLTNQHTSNSVLPKDEILMVTGSLVLQQFGTVSAALFDGVNWQPLYLTSNGVGQSGTINAVFSQSTSSFNFLIGKSYLKKGFVVLIALALAVGLILLIILLGFLVSHIRRRRQGYRPAPSRVSEMDMTGTVPPEYLLREMGNMRR